MATGIEIIDLIAGALTLAFIGRLLLASSVSSNPFGGMPPSGSREKISLLNQQVGPKHRFA